jgi:hypothetical protein
VIEHSGGVPGEPVRAIGRPAGTSCHISTGFLAAAACRGRQRHALAEPMAPSARCSGTDGAIGTLPGPLKFLALPPEGVWGTRSSLGEGGCGAIIPWSSAGQDPADHAYPWGL